MNAALMQPLRYPSPPPPPQAAAADPPDSEEDPVESLRDLCHALIADLTPARRHELALRILHANSREALWRLRPDLLRALSLQFGARVARERVQQLDARRV